MERRILIPPALSRSLPIGGGRLARGIVDFGGLTMGTYWRARVVPPPAVPSDQLQATIAQALALVVGRMSSWEPDSDLGRFRRAPAGAWVQVSPETFTVLRRSLEVAALTDGLYDPTIGGLTDTVGFGPRDPATAAGIFSPAADAARRTVDYRRLQLDPSRHAVCQPGGAQLDLCSSAKGYAVDLVVERLVALGVEACIIEIGGEARGLGCKPDGQPWWCEIEPPVEASSDQPRLLAAACNLALATSGNARRRRLLPDGEIGHILSPDPARPLEPALHSVTVLAPTCLDADAFATALFVLGTERGVKLATQQGLAALFVETPAGATPRESWSPEFAAFLR